MQIFFFFFFGNKSTFTTYGDYSCKILSQCHTRTQTGQRNFKTQRISGVFCLRFQSYLLLVGLLQTVNSNSNRDMLQCLIQTSYYCLHSHAKRFPNYFQCLKQISSISMQNLNSKEILCHLFFLLIQKKNNQSLCQSKKSQNPGGVADNTKTSLYANDGWFLLLFFCCFFCNTSFFIFQSLITVNNHGNM